MRVVGWGMDQLGERFDGVVDGLVPLVVTGNGLDAAIVVADDQRMLAF
jgi:hypothetical protein